MNDNSHEGKLARIEDRLDRPVAGAIAVSRGGSVAFRSMADVMEFSKLMSIAQQAVPKHLRGQPGLCLGIIMQAVAWEMEPFAVAKKSYVVNDNLAYESQLIHAVIEARAPLKKRLRCTYAGEGPERTCTVLGTFVGEDEPHEYTTPKFKDIPVKNSPLWKWDVDQQMFYLASRAWARKWCPDVLLGVYSPDEAQYAGEHATPAQPIIHNPLQDDADVEKVPPKQVNETEFDVTGDFVNVTAIFSDGTTLPREKSTPDHDAETGEVFDAKVDSERCDADAGPATLTNPSNEITDPSPKELKAAGRRPRPKPRQAPAEAAGEPNAEAVPKQPAPEKTSPGANGALGVAFAQPWIRKKASDYEAYLVEWTAAWVAFGQDPNGLRDRYGAERTIRSGLGEPADQDTLTRWKGIAMDAFKKLDGVLS